MKSPDWKNLPFMYMKTDYNVRCYFRDGKWGKLEISSSEMINLHMAATCLHYGQEAFEGLKAFRGKDDKIRIFRIESNAERMMASANGVMMAVVPPDMFKEAVIRVVELNRQFVPPYDSGASLYIRPLLIGSGAQVGVRPADEYLFLVFVTPVGPYFKEGFKPVDIWVCRDYDRAAPLGTGHIKVGGNYASSLIPTEIAHKDGYAAALYLDAKEKNYIDECGPANFLAIKNNTYITPDSHTILPSITNKSLMKLAGDMGMKIETRPVLLDELPTFEEVGMCGTAAVLSPIKKIIDTKTNKIYEYCKDGNPGPVCFKLYEKLRAIQYGDAEDIYNWVTVL